MAGRLDGGRVADRVEPRDDLADAVGHVALDAVDVHVVAAPRYGLSLGRLEPQARHIFDRPARRVRPGNPLGIPEPKLPWLARNAEPRVQKPARQVTPSTRSATRPPSGGRPLSYGNESVGMINWSTCVLYPDGPSCDEVRVQLSLRLPVRWRFATALKAESTGSGDRGKPPAGGLASFKTVSLTELVDSPLIAGEHMRTIALDAGKNPAAYMHLFSESPEALKLSLDVIDLYSRVVKEAGSLFGACHYPEFHFLVTCSNDFGYHGLEHLASSVNGVFERDLMDSSRRKGWVANLIPHEYVHSWCGKFRRPAGMCTPDFQTPLKTRLLWIYEGLAEYLGEVLMVRAGLASPKEYRETLGATISNLVHHEGRRWRPLDDTAVASQVLRGHSPNWNDLRRGQDYYSGGALIWLGADTIIPRPHGEAKKSLDSFCARYRGQPDGRRCRPLSSPRSWRSARSLRTDSGNIPASAASAAVLPLDVLARGAAIGSITQPGPRRLADLAGARRSVSAANVQPCLVSVSPA